MLTKLMLKQRTHFNSIKVRLEPYSFMDEGTFFLYFNSIKVRLEPTADTSGTQVAPFQFHKGAIRTDNAVVSTQMPFIFQFHKGAIRTPFSPTNRGYKCISIP